MNTAIIQVVVALIATIVQTILPKLASQQTTDLIASIVNAFEKLLPDIIAAGEELATVATNIIQGLKSSNGVTSEQWVALDAFETQIDNAFDQAAKDEGL